MIARVKPSPADGAEDRPARLGIRRYTAVLMAVSSQKFQAPKGTRDFYPQDMAVRRYIENVWRTVSINHGFDEVEGPTFENLDLYTHKSGPGIVSEIFQVFSGKDEAELAAVQRTGQAPFALRPEFTPTLARMVAAQADSLPKPIKWFAIPSMFRAERPQRGRLREHIQWNVDFIGVPAGADMHVADCDIEVVSTLIYALQKLGLSPRDVRIKMGHRGGTIQRLASFGVAGEEIEASCQLLDARMKLDVKTYEDRAKNLGWSRDAVKWFHPVNREVWAVDTDPDKLPLPQEDRESMKRQRAERGDLSGELIRSGLAPWCEYDSMVVRGLAYYTGLVFEAHEATGAERAIAGGGRYDNLIESFGGPSLPACGFGMGDVVLSLVLKDKGLLPEDVYMAPLRPHAFVIAADDAGAEKLPKVVADLRKQGFHVRHSYKTTRNVGKLLSEASKARARYAVILGKELTEGNVALKNLASGEQTPVNLDDLVTRLRTIDQD